MCPASIAVHVTKSSDLPSGDHDGWNSVDSLVVSRRAFAPRFSSMT